ncbi:MAG: hypothetical protein KH111_17390 [Bacteroidales bacterium]|nr:hypothetical protein [Bacteroidales bacterium]
MDEVKEKTGENPRPETSSKDPLVNSTKIRKKIKATKTQVESFKQVESFRENERSRVLRVMKGLEHDVCRQEIVILSGLPINHITRIIRDLLDAGMIRVTRLGRSPLTGRLVGMLAVVDKEKE